MNFVEFRFLLFFALVFGLHWALRWNGARKLFLLAASYVFYGAWDWRFLGLILLSTLVDGVAGAGIHRSRGRPARRAWLLVSLVGNLSVLGFFKYYNFFVESGAELLRFLGIGASAPVLEIVLPVGISFYTFQTLSYSIDIYFRRLEPVRHPLDLALFVAFFPQLVAGPIVRAVEFLPQLVERKRFADVDARFALTIFLVGFVKKAVVSDGLAGHVDPVFAAPELYGTPSVWLGMFLFHVQLYCDFSGYSDMAIGSAALLGYRLPWNFAFPYFATNMTHFWQRWHITLGRWLTDYVYIPLGGNRRGVLRTCLNIVVLFFLCGLWHGASWNYVLWGLINGVVLSVERLGLREWIEARPRLLRHLWVHAVWFVTLAFFRTLSIEDALAFLRAMVVPFEGAAGALALHPAWWLAVLAFLLAHRLGHRDLVFPTARRVPAWAFAALFGASVALVLPFVATDADPFIYFQF